MAYHAKTGEILVGMGFSPDDFRAVATGTTTTEITEWFSVQPQPTEAAVEAAYLADPAAFQTMLTVTRPRAEAVQALDNNRASTLKILRALAAVLVDEINFLRQWEMSFKAEVAAASTLADLKTRVATLPNLPNRTLAQAVTSIKSTINAGTVD